nr:ribosomal biogenesis protein LAS1L-like [Leptinotarsa decemlineata]
MIFSEAKKNSTDELTQTKKKTPTESCRLNPETDDFGETDESSQRQELEEEQQDEYQEQELDDPEIRQLDDAFKDLGHVERKTDTTTPSPNYEEDAQEAEHQVSQKEEEPAKDDLILKRQRTSYHIHPE